MTGFRQKKSVKCKLIFLTWRAKKGGLGGGCPSHIYLTDIPN